MNLLEPWSLTLLFHFPYQQMMMMKIENASLALILCQALLKALDIHQLIYKPIKIIPIL